jgi:hypothetical protein
MIAALTDTPTKIGGAWRTHLLAGVTILGWLLVAATIARVYVGHSSSPYGACYAPSGRSVSCAAVPAQQGRHGASR